MDLREMERRMEHRDSSNGVPILECVVVGLVVVEMLAITAAAWWLWSL